MNDREKLLKRPSLKGPGRRRAVYAISGDPIHKGHLDIIHRAASLFEEVIVALGANPDKAPLFSIEERLDMVRRSLWDAPNVKVFSFEGLLVDYAYEQDIGVIVKGVRNTSDFDYENILHLVGESQELGIDTIVLFARPELVHVRSSTIKALQKEEGYIHDYVPLCVKQALEARISHQCIIGVTGEIGTGKTFVSERFCELGKKQDIEVHHIDLDEVGNQILEERNEPGYHRVREEIVAEFGDRVQNPDGTIHRKNLGEIIFRDARQLEKLNRIMAKPLMVRLRKELRGKKGLILLNAALLAESNRTHLCNNNVVLLACDKKSQLKRLSGRGLTPEQIQRRLASQYSGKEKQEIIQASIQANNQGRLWRLDTSGDLSDEAIAQTFHEIIEYFLVRQKTC